MNIREKTQERENRVLSPYAVRSADTKGREREEPSCEIRTEFQRDRDRIIHSKAFRRLKHKTQVFLTPEGDHYRTRLTHTLEVAQIARTIARALDLNEDLTEAIALGHDLGHTPFGHAGERVLNEECEHGFHHNEQSLRVVDVLERVGGLNLTYEVRDGILCHTGAKKASTLEGRAVALSDKIAYINHDIDDAIRGGVLTEKDLPAEYTNVLGMRHSTRIDTMIHSAIRASADKEDIVMEEEIQKAMMGLRQFMFEHVYFNSAPKLEEKKANGIIRELYRYFADNPDAVPEGARLSSCTQDAHIIACDYTAGMTDRFAIATFQQLFVPRSWQG